MAPSNKKKRGKQRKAAKRMAAAAVSADDTNLGAWCGKNTPPEITVNVALKQVAWMLTYMEVVMYAINGKHIKDRSDGLSRTIVHRPGSPTSSIIGALHAVLDILKQCERETFDGAMANVRGEELYLDKETTDCPAEAVRTPSLWIDILISFAKSQEPSFRLQIAQNIGPLINCMCDDTKRLFFNSNEHWRDCIWSFAILVSSLIEEPNTAELMIAQHDGLVRRIAQWKFWGEKHRPDIAKEVEACPSIASLGGTITNAFILNEEYCEYHINTEKGKSLLDVIATTPFVNRDYDPNCMVSYVAGFIIQMKANGCFSIGDNIALHRLIGSGDCVDKGVITEMIDFGLNFTVDSYTALLVAWVSSGMILLKISSVENRPSDTRIAFAIRAGLIEMCLTFIEQFWEHKCFGIDSTDSLDKYIKDIFDNVHSASLHHKSAKAITHKRTHIEEELMRLERNTQISNNAKCKELLDMAWCILDINGTYCCRCNKSLCKKEIKWCEGCNRFTYCSEACQKDDWLNGHKLVCTKPHISEQLGHFQGRVVPATPPKSERAVEKLEKLEINVTRIQLKLLLDNADTILSEARSLNIPLCDCVVSFDLRTCPPTVTTKDYTGYFNSKEAREFESRRSEKEVTCRYFSNIYYGETDRSEKTPRLVMERSFPLEWLSMAIGGPTKE